MLWRMNMILIQPGELGPDRRIVLNDARAKHIRQILKAEAGKLLRIGMLNGPLGKGVVESVVGSDVVLRCDFEASASDHPQIDLLLAMPRPKVLKRLWAQLAALGVGRIVLLRADKVERYYFDSHVLDPAFYAPLLVEGLQQAGCTDLPEVCIEPLFRPYVEDRFPGEFEHHLKLMADPSGDRRIKDLAPLEHGRRIVLAIGPEGGWTPFELEMLGERGFELIGMGGRILRTDTATVGLLALLNEYLSGE